MQEEARGGSALDTVKAVWSRRMWLAIPAFVIPFAAIVSLVIFMPSVYRSTATVLVDRQQVPESMVRATVTSALETRLQTISEEILSRSRLEALINRFSLYADLKKRVSSEEVIGRMRKDIQLELKSVQQKDSSRAATVAFTLSYTGSSPEIVAQVTNTLASFYIEENLKVRERQSAGTAEFLKVQLASVKLQLDEQEAVVSEFKKRHLGELPQQMEMNLSTIERLNTQLRLNLDNQARAMERQDMLLTQLGESESLPPSVESGPGPSPVVVDQQLAKLNQDLRQLRTVYSDKYPDVVRLKEEIAALERDRKQELAEPKPETKKSVAPASPPVNPYVMRLRQAKTAANAEVSVLKSDEKRLRSALGMYVGRVENAPKREQEFREISRDYETTREHYTSLMKRYEESKVAESMEQRQKGEQFRVLDPAVPAQEPAAPNRWRLILMGLAASAGVAVAAVFLAEQLNPAFHSVDELRSFTPVPVLLSISLIVTAGDRLKRQRRARLVAVSVAVGLIVVVGLSFLIAHGNEQLVALLVRGRS